MFSSRFRRFDPGSRAVTERADQVGVGAGDGQPAIVLSKAHHDLARLFDGTRDPAARLAAAREKGIDIGADALEGFAAELSLTGLLRAGSHEPLPVPAQSDEEARQLGWFGSPRTLPVTADDACLPPSTVPGSRNNPGLSGGLHGLVTGKRGQANQISVPLASWPFVLLGRLLIWPVANRATLIAFAAILLACLYAIVTHRQAWLLHTWALWGNFRFVMALVVGAIMTNVIATACRAAAIERYTPERARLGIIPGFIGIPRLFVDTSGAAERASREDRMRIVGSGLIGGAALMVLAVIVWFLTSSSLPMLAHYCTIIAPLAVVVIVVRLNPIAQQDGYFLLGNAINQLDLRLQATTVLFGYERPWMTQARRISRTRLFQFVGLVVGYWILLVVVVFTFAGSWLSARFGGIGFLAVCGVVVGHIVRNYLRTDSVRSNMGRADRNWRRYLPGRAGQIAIGVVLAAMLIPYPYQPGGDFVVLPRDRADVRALIDGDVRDVLVHEGDVVKAGQPIARLDDAGAKARLLEAQSALAGYQANLELAKKGARSEELDAAKQRVATAQTTHDVAVQQAKRISAAYEGKAVPAAEYDRANGAARYTAEYLRQSRINYQQVAAPVREERIRQLEAGVAAAQSLVDLRQKQANDTTIVAPIAGRVVSGKLLFARGTYLARGDLLAQIEDTGERLAEIRLPESAMVGVNVDSEARAKTWAYPGTAFTGKVKTVAPSVERERGGSVVRVQVAVDDPDNRLKSGMTGNAKVDAGWHLTGVVFTRAVVRFLSVTMWSWVP